MSRDQKHGGCAKKRIAGEILCEFVPWELMDPVTYLHNKVYYRVLSRNHEKQVISLPAYFGLYCRFVYVWFQLVLVMKKYPGLWLLICGLVWLLAVSVTSKVTRV